MEYKRILSPNGKKPGAITTVVTVIIIGIFIGNQFTDLNGKLTLMPDALFDLQISRLSSYPLAHLSIFHILLNVISIFPLLNIFESIHGTVCTAMMLNNFSVFAAIMYCLVGRYLYPTTAVAGSSGWGFTLFGYFSLKESAIRPHTEIFRTGYKIPTALTPLISLFVIAVIFPGSSFWGHLFGLIVGYLCGWQEKFFRILVLPEWIIIKIEDKLSFLINLIPGFVQYYREQEIESTSYETVWEKMETLPTYNTPTETFQGPGRVLGTE